MRKQGPCFHCGIDRTPLWRNGPPEKPVLCNACGSRYRLGKPLENYMPLHAIKKKKRKTKRKKVVVVYKSSTSSSSVTDYASSESSTSQNVNCCTSKQENPDENPVENYGSSWRMHSRRRSSVVYSPLSTVQKLQRDLHGVLRAEARRSNRIVSERAEDVLIYNVNVNKFQVPLTEIGLGIVRLKSPVPPPKQQKN